MPNEIALSYSRLSDFEQCKLKFKARYVDKTYPDDSNNPAFKKGNEIHKQLENYVKWKRDNDLSKPSIGSQAANIIPMVDRIFGSSMLMMPEKQIAVDLDWNLCDWFDKPHIVKYRAVIDLIAFLDEETVFLGDYKSGKFYEYVDSPTSQLRLTSVIIFSIYPNVKKITNAYLFVEQKQTAKAEFTRDQLDELKRPFDEAYQAVQTEEKWAHSKNKYCNWCLVQDCPIKK